MLAAGIEDLREKRDEILKQLREDDAEKAKITQELQILTKRLAQVNESIARKVCACASVCTAEGGLCPGGGERGLLGSLLCASRPVAVVHIAHRIACVNVQSETKNEYDKVISETESAYLKILESSQTLLTVLKREAVNISKKKQGAL